MLGAQYQETTPTRYRYGSGHPGRVVWCRCRCMPSTNGDDDDRLAQTKSPNALNSSNATICRLAVGA